MRKRLLLLSLLTITLATYLIFERVSEQTARDRHVKKVTESLFLPLYLNIENTSRAVTPYEIGFRFDNENLTVDKTYLDPYFDELEKEFSFISENPIISFDDYSFRLPRENSTVKIDRTGFDNSEKILHFLENPSVNLELYIGSKQGSYGDSSQIEDKIKTVTAPLLIKYGRNPVRIPAEILDGFIVRQNDDKGAYAKVDLEKVHQYLDELAEKYENDNVKLVKDHAAEAIARTLLYRVTGYEINNSLILPLEGLPKTNGELHDAYLEVIKSQQRLYRFEKGKLVKTYVISTGLTWETPPGNYEVMGKQKMTISYFGNWYMPNYLPIGYINGSYRFGFHSIPYHMDASGNIYSRDVNTMGSPATGGCIQLTPEESLELFDWAWVGLPVYVYE